MGIKKIAPEEIIPKIGRKIQNKSSPNRLSELGVMTPKIQRAV
jgi:hypothetical protein